MGGEVAHKKTTKRGASFSWHFCAFTLTLVDPNSLLTKFSTWLESL